MKELNREELLKVKGGDALITETGIPACDGKKDNPTTPTNGPGA